MRADPRTRPLGMATEHPATGVAGCSFESHAFALQRRASPSPAVPCLAAFRITAEWTAGESLPHGPGTTHAYASLRPAWPRLAVPHHAPHYCGVLTRSIALLVSCTTHAHA